MTSVDFSRLSAREQALLEELGQYTYQHKFLSLLQSEHGDTSFKAEYLEKSNSLDLDEQMRLNKAGEDYRLHSRNIAGIAIPTCTIVGFVYGISTLPARKSALRHTLFGLAIGSAIAYGFWRLQLLRYDRMVNRAFRRVVEEQFNQSRG